MVVVRSVSKGSSSSSNSKWSWGRVSSSREPRSRDRKCTHKERCDRVRPYATEAMNFYNTAMGTKYKLVDPGYITSVCLPTCFLFHIDFTAKKIDVAGAPVEMFFAELTSINQVRCVKFCTSMGPKKLISGDKNNGCLYCEFRNVQHPLGGGFMAGGGGLFTDKKQRIESEQRERNAEMTTRQPLYRPTAKPTKEHMSTHKDRPDHVKAYATEGLNFYNTKMGTKYELVEPGYITDVCLPTCVLHHIDFTAKDTDVAGAPVETFFAELTTTNNVHCVKFCTSMGPGKRKSGDRNEGCCYCEFNTVQHPWGGGFMAGRVGLFTDE